MLVEPVSSFKHLAGMPNCVGLTSAAMPAAIALTGAEKHRMESTRKLITLPFRKWKIIDQASEMMFF